MPFTIHIIKTNIIKNIKAALSEAKNLLFSSIIFSESLPTAIIVIEASTLIKIKSIEAYYEIGRASCRERV